MKELQETNNKIVQSMTANSTAAEYQRIINSFANKHAWNINNLFTGKIAQYGIITGVIGLVLYKLGVLGSVYSYMGSMVELSYKAIKFCFNTLGFLGTVAVNTGSKVKSFVKNLFPDNTNVNSVDEYSSYTNRRINITNMIIQKILSYMGPGKGYMSLVISNMDQIIFEKNPEKLVQFCDKIMSGLKGFNMNDCMSDLVNAYNILHTEHPNIFKELTTPEIFNKMISTLNNKDSITSKDDELYRNINEFDDLKKYLIDYKNNPQKYSTWFNKIPTLPVFGTQHQLANIFGTTGWSYMFIQFLKYMYSLITSTKTDSPKQSVKEEELNEGRTESFNNSSNDEGHNDDEGPNDDNNENSRFYSLLNYFIPRFPHDLEYSEQEEQEEQDSLSTTNNNESEVVINIDNEDIEKGLRKRK